MRSLLLGLGVAVAVMGMSGVVEAVTLEWDRNTESDMAEYRIYSCFQAGCTPERIPAQRQPGAVVQPVAGTVPSYVLDVTGREGAVAVSAVDRAGNESGLSVSVPFDQAQPLPPVNPRLR